jgi:proline iminopeptidase
LGNLKKSDGFVSVLGYNLYYKIFEAEDTIDKGDLLCLHGGPGMTHDYILPLQDMVNFGYRVIFYDQLGCGRSDLPKNLALFTIERAIEDVEGFRKAMNLGKIHLMGSSYGGLLAIAYALKYQTNLRSLITTGGLASVPLTMKEMERLKSELPIDVQETMKRYEDLGEYQNPDYIKAQMVFYKNYLCRLDPWPQELDYTLAHVSMPVYGTMNGPNEFTIIGNMRYWDVTDQISRINVPTLVTGGRYDEVTPKVAQSIHKGIKGSKIVIFEKSAHLPMWEERDKYIKTLADFLTSVNRKRARITSRKLAAKTKRKGK